MIKHKLRQSLYLRCLVCFLSLAWLLPNHYPPWGAFHNDAYAAFILLLVAATVFFITASRQTVWHWHTVAVLACAFIPIAQYLAGQIEWFGTAWINAAYLVGLACAIELGARWEKYAPGRCGDFLFSALLPAGIFSVVISLCQWLDLNVSDLWVLRSDRRPFGNLSQANQTATLYVLSAVGCAWLYRRKKISGFLAGFLTALLLMGLAMSGSRTGWVNAVFIGVVLVGWSYKSSQKRWAAAAVVGLTALGLFIFILPRLGSLLALPEPVDWASRSLLNSRDVIWRLIWDAATRQPIWGYGWGQTEAASLSVAADHPRLDAITTYSHNLFLDLLLWNGLILGGILCFAIGSWMLWISTRAKTLGQWLLILSLSVLGLHAMTEFPLHYAYFLLPAGMIVGMLGQQSGAPVAVTTSRKPLIALFVLASATLVVTVRDYLHIETGFTAIRFESANMKHDYPTTPPDVWALTDLRGVIVMARWQPEKGSSAAELATMNSIALTYASGNNILKMAKGYGLIGDEKRATYWLQMGCNTSPKWVCAKMRVLWESDNRLAAMPWPIK